MNKSELISKVAKSSNITKNEAREAVGVIFESITKALKEKATIRLMDFGTFSVKTKTARKGMNPQTGEQIDIPTKMVPKFKAASRLKKKIIIGSHPHKETIKKVYDTTVHVRKETILSISVEK